MGKSTLMNHLIGEKIAIMSDRPQTTRNKIMCILNTKEAQIIFLDTPGIHKPHHKLGEFMVRTAESTLKEVDVVLFVVDATETKGAGDEFILQQLEKIHTPVILVVNKIDKLTDKNKLLTIIHSYTSVYNFKAVVPLSALTGEGCGEVVKEITSCLPSGCNLFPEDMITDQPERDLAGELIREKALRMTHDEVPHAIAVQVEEFKNRPNGDVFIRATIFVERDSQKGIIIGAGGKMLKNIGRQAREDIENLLGSKVYLELWVKVRADWRNKDKSLQDFGYRDAR